MRQPREGSRAARSTSTVLGRNRSTIATILSLFTVLTLILGQGTLAFAGQSKEIGADSSGSAVAGTGAGTGGGTTGGTGGGGATGGSTGGTIVRPADNPTSVGTEPQRHARKHNHKKTNHKTRAAPVDHKVTICHGTDSYSNPYVVDTPDIGSNGYAEGGHSDHVGPVWYPTIPKDTVWGDIIPAYDYKMADGSIFHYPGLNWTAAGQKIWNNGCRPPPPPVPSIKVTKTCPAAASIGDVITYKITVANTGNETLENLVVNDSMLGALSFPGTLAAGASSSKSVNYTVKASDPDPLHNVVTASAKGAESGKSVSDTAFCDTDIVHQPGIDVSKTCPASANVGDTITYSITVKNTGNETLNSISVTDPLLGNISGSFKSSLAPGESETRTFNYTITPSSTDPVHNVVSASGTGADSGKQVTDSDTCDTDVLHQSGIKVTKTCPATAAIGDAITFAITVENTGNEPLENLIVSDPFLGNVSGFPATLAVGQKVTKTFSYTVTASTPDPIHNVVTVSATGADSRSQVTDSASCDTDIVHNPGIDVSKTCPASAKIGETVTYSITVRNTGDEPLKSVAVQDSILGDLSASFPTTLAVGQSVTKTFNHVVSASDADPVVNEVTASGTGVDSNKQVSDQDSCQTDVLHEPGIDVSKTCPASASIGDVITYSITVKNTGDEPLKNVAVVDPLLGAVSGAFPNSLAVGQSVTKTFTYTLKATDPDPLTNTVTASGTGTDSAQAVSDQASCATDVVHHPGIDVSKTCPAGANVGETITYSITVRNTGDEPLGGLTVTDSMFGDISSSFPNSLTVGQSVTRTFNHVVTASDPAVLQNAVTASATGADSKSDVTDSAECGTNVTQHPAIQVLKDGPALAHVGDEITYTFAVSNTGDVPLHDVALTDPKCDSGATLASKTGGNQDAVLDTGAEVWHYTCTRVVLATDPDPLPNTATAQGMSPRNETVSDQDSHQVDLIHPAISIDKSADMASGSIGQTVTYTYVVTNTGDTDLLGVSVHDDVLGHIGDIPSLAVGESTTLSHTYVLGSDDVTNIATATGCDVLETCVSDDDTVTVEVVHHPGIRVVKGGPALAHVGDEITYTFAVSNTGDVPLHDVTLTDPKCDSPATLASKTGGNQDAILETTGEVWNYTCTHLVLVTDPDPLPNTATAQGMSPRNESVSADASHQVDVIHPAISIDKSADVASAEAGQTVTYTYVVTNTGDTPLLGVSIDDDVLGHIGDIPSLAVGASVTLTHTFEFPEDLVPVVNIGTAAGCDALQGCVSATDTVTVFPVAGVCVVNGKEFPEGDPRCTPEPPEPQREGGVLPFTGSNPAALVVLFGMLVLGGTMLTRATRRRRNEA